MTPEFADTIEGGGRLVYDVAWSDYVRRWPECPTIYRPHRVVYREDKLLFTWVSGVTYAPHVFEFLMRAGLTGDVLPHYDYSLRFVRLLNRHEDGKLIVGDAIVRFEFGLRGQGIVKRDLRCPRHDVAAGVIGYQDAEGEDDREAFAHAAGWPWYYDLRLPGSGGVTHRCPPTPYDADPLAYDPDSDGDNPISTFTRLRIRCVPMRTFGRCGVRKFTVWWVGCPACRVIHWALRARS